MYTSCTTVPMKMMVWITFQKHSDIQSTTDSNLQPPVYDMNIQAPEMQHHMVESVIKIERCLMDERNTFLEEVELIQGRGMPKNKHHKHRNSLLKQQFTSYLDWTENNQHYLLLEKAQNLTVMDSKDVV